MKLTRVIALVTALLSVGASQAAQVWFTSSIGGGHVTSAGSPLRGDTIVELGAFAPGFVPTAANTADWKQNWIPAARSLYDEVNGWYSGTFTLTNNTGAFATTQQGWIWVYNRSGEWCLYSKPSWTWPSSAGDNITLPSEWAVEDASQVVVGEADAQDNEFVTAQVQGASPTVSFTQWAALMFGANGASPDADNDGDGASNFAEYAFGSRADLAGSVPPNVVRVEEHSGVKYLTAEVNRGWVTGVDYVAELSEDLENWDSGTESVVVLPDTAAGFIARDKHPLGTRERCFMRVQATPE